MDESLLQASNGFIVEPVDSSAVVSFAPVLSVVGGSQIFEDDSADVLVFSAAPEVDSVLSSEFVARFACEGNDT